MNKSTDIIAVTSDLYFLDRSNMADNKQQKDGIKSGKLRLLRNELNESELKDLVSSLTSECWGVLRKSLLKLHKHFKQKRNFTVKVKEFYEIGGLTNILQLLLKPNAKWMEKAIDILTICCRVKECREMISNTETISFITSMFKFYYKNEIIQVSLCETISNLSAEKDACAIFHNLDINSAITDFLLYCRLPYSQAVATVALQNLNHTPPLRKQILQKILTKFNPTDNNLIRKIIETVAELKDQSTEITAQQIRTTIGIANLVICAQSSDKNLQRASLEILTQITDESYEFLGEIGEAGIIPIYTNLTQEFLKTRDDDKITSVFSLCQLLDHVDNRDRMFQIINGFETLISLLHQWDDLEKEIQESTMDAIIQFFFEDEEYNESHILKFLNLDLVSILINILDNHVKATKTTHQLLEGTEFVIFAKICPDLIHIRQIMHILSILSSKQEFHVWFRNSAILDVLLRAWLSGSHDQPLKACEDIVMQLVGSDVCFEDLILLQFPQMVRKIMDDSDLQHSVHSCSVCEHVQVCQISILNLFETKVQSEYGLENINRLLTTGSESVKRTVAMMLPYILATERERYNHVPGVYDLALDLFLKNLADPSNDNFQVSLNTFFEICEEVEFSDIDSFSHETHKRDYCVLYGKELDKDVHFILDDGERVSVNRSILIQSSEMFDAMLNGHFMEANQSEIRFKDASTEMFKFIFHFLHGCTDSGKTSCPVLRNAYYEFLFEASNMADRMVLMDLKDSILGIIVKKLTSYSAVSVCRYAQQNNYTTFLSLLVDHLVVPSVGKNYKTELFTEILSSDLNEHLLDEIKWKIEFIKSLYF